MGRSLVEVTASVRAGKRHCDEENRAVALNATAWALGMCWSM